MRYFDSIFGHLLEPIERRWFERVVARHDGDAYIKEFTSWDHLCLLVYAQLSGIEGLRGLVATWNANAHHHYHLGVGDIARSTISDANARRPLAIFKETFCVLSGQASRQMRREGNQMLRLIDSTPIPLGRLFGWAKSNGRIRGLKLHTIYDPQTDTPTEAGITHANINDIEVGESFPIEAGATYVMDKAYCKYPWWTAIHEGRAMFVTPQKTSSRFRAIRRRKLKKVRGDGFTIIDDAEVRLVSKGDSKLTIPMRRIRLRRDDGGKLTLLTSDITRSAVNIGELYKLRWQIELLFRWVKQHLKIKRFLGRNTNAICLQTLAAMIAYVLLRLAAQTRSAVGDVPLARDFAGRVHQTRTVRPACPINPDKPVKLLHIGLLCFTRAAATSVLSLYWRSLAQTSHWTCVAVPCRGTCPHQALKAQGCVGGSRQQPISTFNHAERHHRYRVSL